MNEAELHPPRPRHEAVAAALVAVADGLPFLASFQPSEADHDLQRLDLVDGWRLAIWWRRGEMGPLHSATDPQGLHWVYGCGRWPGWDAGPAAVVLDPIRHLLDDDQRQALRAQLLRAVCWPPVEPYPLPPLRPLAELWSDEDLLYG